MKRILLLATLAVVGCETYEGGVQRGMAPWIGQPVRAYAEAKMKMPSGWDRPDGSRMFVFDYGTCQVSIVGVSPDGQSEYINRGMQSTCPPGW